jgi:hypothetical protein
MGKSKMKKELIGVGKDTCTYLASKWIYQGVRNVSDIPNPIRRGIRYGEWTLATPVVIPVAVAVDLFCAGAYIAMVPVALAGAMLYGIGYAAIGTASLIDGAISRFDEMPELNQENIPREDEATIADKSNEDSQVLILKILNAKQIIHARKFNSYTMDYIQSFNEKVPYSTQIKDLHLTEEEELKFKNYLDPITHNYINIPVRLNERLYDLETLIKCFDENKKDPFNNITFKLEQIATDRESKDNIQKLINSIQKKRDRIIEKPCNSDIFDVESEMTEHQRSKALTN